MFIDGAKGVSTNVMRTCAHACACLVTSSRHPMRCSSATRPTSAPVQRGWWVTRRKGLILLFECDTRVVSPKSSVLARRTQGLAAGPGAALCTGLPLLHCAGLVPVCAVTAAVYTTLPPVCRRVKGARPDGPEDTLGDAVPLVGKGWILTRALATRTPCTRMQRSMSRRGRPRPRQGH